MANNKTVTGPPLNQPMQIYWLIELVYQAQFTYDYDRSGEVIVYFEKYWHVSLYYVAVYLSLVFFGYRYMASREPFNLRKTLTLWSGALAVFATSGAIAVWPEFIRTWRDRGLRATYCQIPYRNDNRIGYWYLMFVLSKIPELFDTAFIVLRKTRLLPLHWIHHSLALTYSFYVLADSSGSVRWMAALNLLVHSVMYVYFCLKARQWAIPRSCAIFVTFIQVVQMFLCVFIHMDIIWMHYRGTAARDCPDSSLKSSIPGLLLYLLFVYVFVNFFLDNYVRTPKSQKDDNKHNNHNNNFKKSV